MDDFKNVTLFLILGITISTFVPVKSNYGVFQPQYFRVPALQQPYTPYGYYDIFRVNPGGRTVPGAVYPNGLPAYPQPQPPQVPTVYNYFGTPVYDFRYPGVPFYPGGRPIFPPPPPPPGPQDPSSKDKPGKDDDGIEKLDKKASKKKDKKKKPEESADTPEPSEDATEPTEPTEPSDDTVTVDALE